jgi:cytochrome c oxidase subunit 2
VPSRLLTVLACAAVACSGGSNLSGDANDQNLPVIQVNAHQWAFSPDTINLKKGSPVVLELTTSDVHHGFNLPDLGVRADIIPGKTTRVRVDPDQAGTFYFHCDYYCGTGHEGMQGQVVVE